MPFGDKVRDAYDSKNDMMKSGSKTAAAQSYKLEGHCVLVQKIDCRNME